MMYIISRDAPLCDRVWKNSDDGKPLDAFSSYERFHLPVLKVDFQRFDSCILQDIYPVLLSVANLKNWKKKLQIKFHSREFSMDTDSRGKWANACYVNDIDLLNFPSVSYKKKIATKLTPQKGNNNKKATTKQPKKKTKTFFLKKSPCTCKPL